MPIPSTGEIKLNDDVNATLQADTNESNVSLGDNNTVKFTAVGDGTTVSGRSMSELRGQTLFQINPSTAATGALGQSLHMDGLSSSHNSVKVLEPASTTAPAFTNTKGTFSFWIKIHETTSSKRYLYTSGTSSSNSLVSILLHSSGTNHKLYFRVNAVYHTSEAIFVDKAGWYNFVISLDSSIIGDVSKVKAYANGIPLNWSSIGNLTDNQAFQFGTNQRINDWAFGDGYGADATYANFIFVDGSALLPNEFGELSQGIWVPKGINTPSSQSLVTTNLVADYQFQGNANDTSVGGTTYNGTPSNVTFQQNNYNIASFTGGSASQISLGASSQFTSSTLTFSFWYMPTAAPSGTSYKILFSNYNTGSPNFNISRNTDNSLEFGVITGSSGTWYRKTGPNAVELNNWKHYAFVFDSSQSAEVDKIKVYVDSVLVSHSNNSGTSTTGNFLNTSNNLLIGNWVHQAGYTDTSKFGELQIYTSALTETQVLQNFNATKYKYFYGLNGWHLNFNNSDEGSIVSGSILNFDAGDWDADGTDETSFSGTAWDDLSSNSYDMAFVNSPTWNAANGGYFDFDDADGVSKTAALSGVGGDITAEWWINPDETQNFTLFHANSTNTASALNGLYFGNAGSAAGDIEIYRYYSGGNSSCTINTGAAGMSSMNTEGWIHFVITLIASDGAVKAYKNGALIKTATLTNPGNSYYSTYEYAGLSTYYLSSYRYDGKMAQFRLYSKALTAQEVVQNFRATQGHYEVLSLADISGNAKGGIANGTNLDGSDHTGDKPDVSYATLSSLAKSSYITLSNGGTALTHSQSSWRAGNGTIGVNSGKWYYEVKMTAANTSGATANNAYFVAGWEDASLAGGYESGPFSTPYNRVIGVSDSGAFGVITSGTSPNYGTSNINGGSQFAVNDVLGIALDADTGSVQIYKNGSALGSAVTLTADAYMIYYAKWSSTHGNGIFNFGAKGFAHTPPTGYKALSSDNLPTATGVDPVNLKKPRDYFESVTYNGTGIRNEIKSLDFQPDFIWIQNIKSTSGYYNALIDSVRGTNSILSTNSTAVEQTSYIDQLKSFDTNGFSLGNNSGSGNYVNLSGNEYIAWAWKAGGAPTVDNSASAGAAPTLGSVMIDGVASTASLAGSIAATKISANTKSGFSIVSFTNGSSGTSTISHGLSSAPQLILMKQTDGTTNWVVYSEAGGAGKTLVLNQTSAFSADNAAAQWGSVPTSSVFTVTNNSSLTNASKPQIAYCFHSVDGYSKIGSYTGNGLSNGPFIYTGFKPAWLLVKESSASGGYWYIVDNKRNTSNPRSLNIFPNATDAEASYGSFNFLSNGFQPSNNWGDTNADNETYFYMAFAEDPAKYAQGTGQESDTEKFLEKGAGETSYPEDNFKTVHWTGNGGFQTIDNVGFKPGFVWTQARSFGNYPQAFDSIRGVTKELEPATTSGEATNADSLTSFTDNGFTLGSSNNVNQNTSTYKAWCWKAGDTIETKKPTYTSAGILTSNLALHYNFADSNTYAGSGTTVYDLTSNDNDGALTNAPTWIDRANGNYFDFDGSNDFIECTTIKDDVDNGQSVSMEVWFKCSSSQSGEGIICGFGGSSGDAGMDIGVKPSTGLIYMSQGSGSTGVGNDIRDNKWHHAVMTMTSSVKNLYLDGILIDSSAATNRGTFPNDFHIGTWADDAYNGYYYKGAVGQVRIYTAELTQAQIRANYDATRTLYQGVGTTANVLQTGLLNNIDVDSFSSYDSSKFGADNKVAVFPGGNATGTDNGTGINLPTNIDDPMRAASAFTISVWYKHDTQNNSYGGKIVSLLNNIYNFISVNTNGTWYGRVANSSNTSTEIDGLEAFSVGTWYHIVWTGNAANGCTLYCNGVKQGNGAWNGTFMNYSSPHYQHNKIGHQGIEVGYLKGSIDMVRFYNREVTSAEVKTLFHETSATTGTLNTLGDTSCYAAYNFNSDSGTTVNDLSDNYDAVSFGSLSFATDAEVTGWMVKDLTSNKNDLGGFYNATISKANSWGTSIKYDGTGDFVTLPVGLGRTATQDVTRELWVKIDDLPAGSNSDGLLYIGDMGTSQYYENLRVTSDGTIDYQERPNAGTGGAQDFLLSTSSYAGTLSEGVWYHVAYTVQGRLKKIYINGKLVATKTASYDKVNNSTYGGSLGSFKGSSVATTQGEIAQFRSYTSALTDAQIKANFDATKAQFYSPLIHSLVSVNDKAGFSIVKYIGEGNETDVVSHGQSASPDFIITKRYNASGQSWNMRTPHSKNPANSLTFPIGSNDRVLSFNGTWGYSNYTMDAQTNTAGGEYISYCFRNIPGYMKIGEYIGNMNTDGPRVYTGFRPRFIATKSTDAAGSSWLRWYIKDLASDIDETVLYPNYLYAAPSYDNVDIFGDGFQIKANDDTSINGNGVVFFYWAIA